MMCATATGYISLLLWRMGVGVGEAAGSPTSQSIITDYFPAEKRASAISILYLGIPLGIICSALGTGYIVEHFGWRYAFLIRSEEHTSELQSLMRISYAVFCLKKKNLK